MRRDARIAKKVINAFVLAGRPIIPVHDSFVVRAPQLETLLEQTCMALREVLGHQIVRLTQSSLPSVKVKVPRHARAHLPASLYCSKKASEKYLMALPRGIRPRLDTQWQAGLGDDLKSSVSLYSFVYNASPVLRLSWFSNSSPIVLVPQQPRARHQRYCCERLRKQVSTGVRDE